MAPAREALSRREGECALSDAVCANGRTQEPRGPCAVARPQPALCAQAPPASFSPLIQRLKPCLQGRGGGSARERGFPKETARLPGSMSRLCRALWTSPGWLVSDLKCFWKTCQKGAGPFSFPCPISNIFSFVIANSREGIFPGDNI